MEITYRAATAEDRPEWSAMRHELWPECPVARHQLEIDELLAGDGVVVVAERSRELIGFAEVSIRSDHVAGTCAVPVPYLEGWFVRAGHRGEGVGRGLLDFVERWAIDRGFEELASDAEIQNQTGVTMHAKLGFTEVERTVHFVKSLRPRKISFDPHVT